MHTGPEVGGCRPTLGINVFLKLFDYYIFTFSILIRNQTHSWI